MPMLLKGPAHSKYENLFFYLPPKISECKLLLNGFSHDTKVGCVRLVWAEAEKYKF